MNEKLFPKKGQEIGSRLESSQMNYVFNDDDHVKKLLKDIDPETFVNESIKNIVSSETGKERLFNETSKNREALRDALKKAA